MRRMLLLAALLVSPFPLTHSANAAAAQATLAPATIQGRVLDATRMPIAGARVTAVLDNQASGPSTVTDQVGAFTLPVDPGRYTVSVAGAGFLEASQVVRVSQSGVDS